MVWSWVKSVDFFFFWGGGGAVGGRHHTFPQSTHVANLISLSHIYYVIFYNIQCFLDTVVYSLYFSTYFFGNSIFLIHCSYKAHYSAVPFYQSAHRSFVTFQHQKGHYVESSFIISSYTKPFIQSFIPQTAQTTPGVQGVAFIATAWDHVMASLATVLPDVCRARWGSLVRKVGRKMQPAWIYFIIRHRCLEQLCI